MRKKIKEFFFKADDGTQYIIEYDSWVWKQLNGALNKVTWKEKTDQNMHLIRPQWIKSKSSFQTTRKTSSYEEVFLVVLYFGVYIVD